MHVPRHPSLSWTLLLPLALIACGDTSSTSRAHLGPAPEDPASESPDEAMRSSPEPEHSSSAPARSTAQIRAEGNHLVGEPSPYLQQHAHNPVDWYAFGPEALERARRENKPVFLSIGYSTCHWCHVMEHESFENDEVATYLNTHFIAIKVDREQRPDLDALYMEAVRQLGGSTGWPLTVFLTPEELLPIFGGTYFPPTGRGGRPGFMDILRRVQSEYQAGPAEAGARGRQIFRRISEQASRHSAAREVRQNTVGQAMLRLSGARDLTLGGFGQRQKFPNTPLLLAELRYALSADNEAARAHLLLTLEQMQRGGIHDVLGGAFHRYSVDRRWHLPHFEKTLYDNAQLAQVYLEAGLAYERPDFVRTARAVLDDLIANFQLDDGGLIVGFDADDPGGEGAYYTWTPQELTSALGDSDGAAFAALYGVTATGDSGLEGRSVLHRIEEPQALSGLGLTPSALQALEARALDRLRIVRVERRPPARDDKELAAWNGLALIALADAGRLLDEPRYVQAAQRVASFLLDHCWDPGEGMGRGVRGGRALGTGFLDDHALSALGLLRLHGADGDRRWLVAAQHIAALITDRFYDASGRVFYNRARGSGPSNLPLRQPDMRDGVLPAGGTAATLLMLELGAMAGDRAQYEVGESVAGAHAQRAMSSPFGAGFFLVAIDHLLARSHEVVIAGDPLSSSTRAMAGVLRSRSYSRVLPLFVPASGPDEELTALFPALAGKQALSGRTTAYVCEFGQCQLPTSDPRQLRRNLDQLGREGSP